MGSKITHKDLKARVSKHKAQRPKLKDYYLLIFRRLLPLPLSLIILLSMISCKGKEPAFKDYKLAKVRVEKNYLKDERGRYLFIHGLNVSGSDKFPVGENPSKIITEDVSYVGKPLNEKEAEKAKVEDRPLTFDQIYNEEKMVDYLNQIKDLGFNAIRLILMWEGVEHEGRGKYDNDYLDYIEEIVKKANEHNIYVLMDFHQDIFSRHLVSYYNDEFEKNLGLKDPPARGTSLAMFLSLLPPYTDSVRGDGAPRWAVQACLPEKDLDSEYWGWPRFLGLNIGDIISIIEDLGSLLNKSINMNTTTNTTDPLSVMEEMGIEITPEVVKSVSEVISKEYSINQTSDLLPWSNWGVNGPLSLDIQRCFASLLAGDVAYPDYEITITTNDMIPDEIIDEKGNKIREKEGDVVDIKEYLQRAYANSWRKVAERVKGYPNVIGYDIMNEPIGVFITLTAVTAFFELKMREEVINILNGIWETDKTKALDDTLGARVFDMLAALNFFPPDTEEDTREEWGFKHASLDGILSLNYAFNRNFMSPFYERIGRAIQEVDGDAVIWIEPALGLETITAFFGGGGGGETYLEMNMTRPEGLEQVVYAPHWYPDIYPFPGFVMEPREFTPEEVKFRNYHPNIEATIDLATRSLGNIPVVVGETGTWFNYNQPGMSITDMDIYKKETLKVTDEILDNLSETYEEFFLHHMFWCYSPENTFEHGDGWNHEDFSIIGPGQEPRSASAYSRPYPRFLSGKPLSMHFYSDHHYFDPEKGIVDPKHEFELKFHSKETEHPTEIFVPDLQYKKGFYVWLSDGYCIFDHNGQILYYYPERDEPGHIHSVLIRPPLEGQENIGWDYFFYKDMVVNGK